MTNDRLPAQRPARLMVSVPGDLRPICARCFEPTPSADTAIYTRTSPGTPFEPWCVACAEVLLNWALVGATANAIVDGLEEP